MKELSIFVDESGDFGEYEYHSPFYIIGLVFHDQNIDISSNIAYLEAEMSNIGFPDHCIHAGPLIRFEEEYQFYDVELRQRILKKLMSFIRKTDICCKALYIEKKHINDSLEAVAKLSKLLSRFIRENYGIFLSYDRIKIYYDNGQTEVNKILASVFNTLLDNVEVKRVVPSDYRLFQVADLVCTLKLAELKAESHMLSKSELRFFENERTLRKNYLKPLKDKTLR